MKGRFFPAVIKHTVHTLRESAKHGVAVTQCTAVLSRFSKYYLRSRLHNSRTR